MNVDPIMRIYFVLTINKISNIIKTIDGPEIKKVSKSKPGIAPTAPEKTKTLTPE